MSPPKKQTISQTLPWGECCCPSCNSVFKASQDAVRFFARYKGDAVLYMLCPVCVARYDQSTLSERSRVRDDCVRNIESFAENRSQFACTTYLAVVINHGDYGAALENGTCGLDRASYEILINSDEATLFVNGSVVYWERLPEAMPTPNCPTTGNDQDLH